MKILFGGNIRQGNQEASIIRALKQLGVEVSGVNFEDYFKLSLSSRVFNKLRITNLPHYFGTGRLNRQLIEACRRNKPDLVLLFKPILVSPRTVRELRKIAMVFSWYPDYVPFAKTCSRYFCQSIPVYDCHFSFHIANVKALLDLGARKSVYLPCAADLLCNLPTKLSEDEKKKWGADIVFVGTFVNEERFWYLEKLCQEGYDIKIYGNSWEKCPADSCLARKGCIQFKEVRCKDMSRVFNASKVVLAFLHKRHKDTLTCRSYEIPASGAFMLHERTDDVLAIFEEGREAEFFSSYEEMKKKIDFYLNHDDLRQEVAAAGRRKIIAGNHIFTDRVKVILDIYRKSV